MPLKISKTKERRLRKWKDRSWELSRGQCPEPDLNYWAGFNHALQAIYSDHPRELYPIRRLEDEEYDLRSAELELRGESCP